MMPAKDATTTIAETEEPPAFEDATGGTRASVVEEIVASTEEVAAAEEVD